MKNKTNFFDFRFKETKVLQVLSVRVLAQRKIAQLQKAHEFVEPSADGAIVGGDFSRINFVN